MTHSYQKYSKEIKNRLSLLFFAWMCCFNTCYYYKETILFVLINANNSFLKLNNKPYFIITNVTELFYAYFELVLFVSNQVTIIILMHQIFMFLSLGLYQFEAFKLKQLLKFFVVSWTLSSVLLFKFIIPFSWKFFLSFKEDLTTTNAISFFFEAKLNEYLQHFISLYYVCLTCCLLLAILILILTSFSEKLKKVKTFRRLFYLMFVIFSTVVTPPDIISQVLVCSFLILMYESLIFLKEIRFNMAAS